MPDKTHLQRRVLVENARTFGKQFGMHLSYLLGLAAVVVIVNVLPWPRMALFVSGFCVGVALTVLSILTARPGDPTVAGQWAEEWSLESLRKVKGWLIIDNLPFAGYDVDHVAVAASTVLAVETKYRGRVSSPRLADDRHRRELQATTEAARKLNLFLGSKKITSPVTPLLMVWGPGRPALPDGYRRDGAVFVVDAQYPELWSHLFAAPTLTAEARTEIHAAIQGYAKTRADHEAVKQGPLRREMWTAFRDGRRQNAKERRSRRELRQKLQRRHARKSADGAAAA